MADAKRPSPRERVDRAVAAARPAVERARATAEPRVEKAAARAGSIFGQLRDRAKETAKGFGEGYKGTDDAQGAPGSGHPEPEAPERPTRPRPGPGR